MLEHVEKYYKESIAGLKVRAIKVLWKTQQCLHDSLVDIDPKTIETQHYVSEPDFLRLTFNNSPFPKIYHGAQATYIYEKYCKEHEEPEELFLHRVR